MGALFVDYGELSSQYKGAVDMGCYVNLYALPGVDSI